MSASATSQTSALVDPRGAMDCVWPLSYGGAFVVVFVSGYFGLAKFDLALVASLLLLGLCAHLVVVLLLDSTGLGRRAAAVLLGLHLGHGVLLALAWSLIGPMNHQGFAVFFMIPAAMGGIAFWGWARFAAIAGLLLAVALAAVQSSAALRWYAGAADIPVTALNWLAQLLQPETSDAGDRASPGSQLQNLLLILIGLPAVEWAANAIFQLQATRAAQQDAMIASLRQSGDLAQGALLDSHVPFIVALAETSQVILMNQALCSMFGLRRAGVGVDAAGAVPATVFDVLKTPFPESLEALIGGEDGSTQIACTGPDGRLLTLRLHVQHSSMNGARVAQIAVEDRTRLELISRALDVAPSLIVIVDAGGKVLYSNARARTLFPDAIVGAMADHALQHRELPQGWWRTPANTDSERQIRIEGRALRGHASNRLANQRVEGVAIISLTDREAA